MNRQEEELLIRHFCWQIFICFGVPNGPDPLLARRKWRVPATASVFLQRFYQKNSILDYDPRVMMLSSIFLAGKVEESFVSVKELMRIYSKGSELSVLSSEVKLLEDLNFQVNVSHSRSLVHSLIADIKDATNKSTGVLIKNEFVGGGGGLVSASTTSLSDLIIGDAYTALKTWLQNSEEMLLDVLTTPIVLRYSALIVATCVLKLAAPNSCNGLLEKYLKIKFGLDESVAYLKPLESVKDAVDCARRGIDAELLRTMLLKLKSANRWSKGVEINLLEAKEAEEVPMDTSM